LALQGATSLLPFFAGSLVVAESCNSSFGYPDLAASCSESDATLLDWIYVLIDTRIMETKVERTRRPLELYVWMQVAAEAAVQE
jgi:hypothetical protein